MSENDLSCDPLGNGSITPPSADLQQTPDNLAAPEAGWERKPALEERSFALKPRWPHPNMGWSLLWCLLFVFVTEGAGSIIVIAILTGLAIFSQNMLPPNALKEPADLLRSNAMAVALAVGFFFKELLTIGFSWLVIRLVVGRDWKRQLALRLPSLAHTLLALASLPALWFLASILYDVLRTTLPMPDFVNLKEVEKIFSKWPWGFTVLVIGLGPGIGEELWCRGFLGRGLLGNYGVVFGVVATSFFFGLIHLDPCQGTMAMLMGLWLHFIYLTTRSLLLPMLLHTLNNSLSVLTIRVPQLQTIELQPSDIPWSVYASALVLLAGVGYALYQSRARLAALSPEQFLVWRPAFEGVEYPPADSGARVVHPSPSLAAAALAAGGFLLFMLAFADWLHQIWQSAQGG